MNARKPHNNTPGYVTERKSYHPKLPGHFVILDRKGGADDIDADHRWVVAHVTGSEWRCFVSVASLKSAREIMYAVCRGSDDIDFGQHE